MLEGARSADSTTNFVTYCALIHDGIIGLSDHCLACGLTDVLNASPRITHHPWTEDGGASEFRCFVTV